MQYVSGYLQTYEWGPVDGLDPWTPATGGPQAELWFGTHPNGPSPLLDGSGPATAALPILAKILAAARPLSIQIHPSAELAQAMYADQQAHPEAPALVSDPYGKAELLIAFEPFLILEGFREPALCAQALAELGPVMEPVVQALLEGEVPRAIRLLLAMDREAVVALAARLPEAFAATGSTEHTVSTVAELVEAFPGDPGVFVASLLKARTLEAGQAVFVDPGTVHAYVRGLGLEVMTNSDNVLRLGLTGKTIAVDEALRALDSDAQPHSCDPQEVAGVTTYAPPSAPFAVDVVRDAPLTVSSGQARIIVCLEGTTDVDGVALGVGEGALVETSEPDVHLIVQGVAVVAHAQTGPSA